jgi:hypothetical protein
MQLFQQMQQEGMNCDKFILVQVINACVKLKTLQDGKHVHEQIIENGFEYDIFVGNSLVDMHAKCESMEDTWNVFNKMPF